MTNTLMSLDYQSRLNSDPNSDYPSGLNPFSTYSSEGLYQDRITHPGQILFTVNSFSEIHRIFLSFNWDLFSIYIEYYQYFINYHELNIQIIFSSHNHIFQVFKIQFKLHKLTSLLVCVYNFINPISFLFHDQVSYLSRPDLYK